MQRAEALALVATLQAAFPAGQAGRATVELYAHKLERYDADHATKAIDSMITERHEAFLPTWADIHDALIALRPRPLALPEPEGVPPTPEQQKAIDELIAGGEKRTAELQRGVRLRFEKDKAKETG